MKRILAAMLSVMLILTSGIFAGAADAFAVSIQSLTDIEPGTTVDVAVTLKNNPGVAYIKLTLTASDGLTINDVAFTDGGLVVQDKIGEDGKTVVISADAVSNVTREEFFTLSVTVAEDAAAEQTITGKFADRDPVLDQNMDNIDCTIEAATIAVKAPEHVHDYVEDATTAVDATCTTEGKTADKVCSSCGDIVSGTVIPMLDHTEDEGVVEPEPTETTEGVKTFTCTVCGATRTESIPMLDHTHVYADTLTAGEKTHWYACACNAKKDEVAHTWVAGEKTDATCTVNGSQAYSCVCGATKTEPIVAKHTYSNAVITPATCTEAGKETITCSVCGNTVTETIPALGHNFGKWTVVTEATEDAEGEERRDCSRCDAYETRAIEKLDNDKWDYIIDSLRYYAITQANRTYKVTTSASEGGEIEGAASVKNGKSATYTITPDEGYEIVSVLVNGKDLGAIAEVTLENVRANTKIEVVFAEIVEEAAIEDLAWENPFVDVADDAAYIDAIEFVYENGLFKGISDIEFAPDTTMTRAMFVTVLGRLHGIEEDYTAEVTFEDVVAGEWYAPYVAWAAENGIVNGYSATEFGVNNEITVEQATAIIARYAAFIEIDTAVEYDLTADFADAADVAEWALADMTWAVAEGIYEAEELLAPQAPATRALVATMLYNFVG